MKNALQNNWLMIRYVMKYCPKQIIFTLFSSLLNSCSSIIGILYTKYIIESMLITNRFEIIIFYSILIFVFNMLVVLINTWLNQYIFPVNSQILTQGMQREIFKKAQALDYECYEDPKFYNQYTMALQQASSRALTVLETFNAVFTSVLSIIGFGIIITVFDPVLLTIVILNVLITTIYSIKNSKLQHQNYEERVDPSRSLNYATRIFYQIEYAKELRLSGCLSNLIENRYDTGMNKMLQIIKKYASIFFKRNISQSFLLNFLNLINTIYLTYKVLNKFLNISEYVALNTSVYQLTGQINQLILVIPKMYENSLYIEKFKEFMSYKPKIVSGDKIIKEGSGVFIEFKDVEFKYPSAQNPIFNGINLYLNTKEKIAIVGENGSGKSTILKLLTRLYEPISGQILVQNEDIKSYNLSVYRDKIGILFQDFQIFALSIAENVLMRPIESNEDVFLVDNALKKVGLYEKISNLQQGIFTTVTREFDDGVFLSGGEFQKLAIARLYAKSSNLILLDEPSSSLDPISEKELFDLVLDIFSDKTVIVVTHRLTNVKRFQKIVYLKNGKISEEGTHEELMRLNSGYATLFNAQKIM